MSTTTSPVTHRAETAVNKASTKERGSPRTAAGRDRRKLPSRAVRAKLRARIWGGDSLLIPLII